VFYRSIKPLVTFATRQYFREVRVRGEPVEEGALLIVANHPNVMLDALLVIDSYKRKLWFLVKSTVFKGPWINWLLRLAHMVPVHRKQDMTKEMGDNAAVFSQVVKKLGERVAVLIFPEGVSMAARQLMKVKTGAARIAFQAEEDKGFELGLLIQPVGITYSDFFRFNSSATLAFGRPIKVSEYQSMFKKDPVAAVGALTREIESRMKLVTVEVSDEEHASLVEKIAKLYRSKGQGLDDMERLKAVSENVAKVAPHIPEKVSDFEKRLTTYLQLSSSLKLDGSEDLNSHLGKLFMLLVSPFVLFGVLIHLIPFRMSVWMSSLGAKHRSQYSSWGLSAGFFLFSLWYALICLLVWYLSGSVKRGIFSVVVVMISGYYAAKYFNQFALFVFSTLWPGRKTPVDVLRAIRDDLVNDLEEFRVV